MRDEVRLALEVPRWAWRFYRRHAVAVVGLSLIPSVQRLMVVNWGEHFSPAVKGASEVVVIAVRLALGVLIWRLAMRGSQPSWEYGKEFARTHWRSLVVQGGLLAVAFAFFDFFLEQVVGGLFPESAQQTYLAVLLAVKNPTIVAFTIIWTIGIFRQLLREPVAAR